MMEPCKNDAPAYIDVREDYFPCSDEEQDEFDTNSSSSSKNSIQFGNETAFKSKSRWLMVSKLLGVILLLACIAIVSDQYIYKGPAPQTEMIGEEANNSIDHVSVQIPAQSTNKKEVKNQNPLTSNELGAASLEEYKLSIHINASMDRTQNPCNNFYAYACGGYIRQNPIPSSYLDLSLWGVFSKTTWEINKWIQKKLEAPRNPQETKSMHLAKIFFNACVTDQIAERSDYNQRSLVTTEAEKAVDDIYAQVVKDFGNFSIPAFLGALRNSLGMNFGIETSVIPIMSAKKKNSTGGTYNRKKFGLKVMPSNRTWVNVNINLDNPILLDEEGISFEEVLIKLGMGASSASDTFVENDDFDFDLTWDDETYQQLPKRVNRTAQWADYFKAALKGVTEDRNEIIYELEDTKTMIDFSYHFDDPYNRLFWVDIVIKYFIDLQNVFYPPISHGKESNSYRNIPNLSLFSQGKAAMSAEQCTLTTKIEMTHAIGSEFVKEQFSPAAKKYAIKMYQNILQAFKNRVNESKLWGEKTKIFAKAKANALIAYIGYPEWITNKTALNKYYEKLSLDENMSYFQLRVKLLEFNSRSELKKIISISDGMDVEWLTPVFQVNAYNMGTEDVICIPAGIIRPPFYGFPRESMNYGSLGSIIGHELTHSFDNNLFNYGINGEPNYLLENESNLNFYEQMQCLKNQTENYYFEDISMQVDGMNTLGENIADNGGLAQAYRAYIDYVKKNGPERPLFGLEFTPEQLFFISNAQHQCTTYSIEGLNDLIDNDGHSPDEVRVLQSMSNSKEFHAAFNCPITEIQCELW